MPQYSVAYWREDQPLMTVTVEAADIEAATRFAQGRLQRLQHAAQELRVTAHEYGTVKSSPPSRGEG
jgi:hypothetical protein